jgi:hypothetical protein
MNDILVHLPNETEDQCLWRIGKAKDSGLLTENWPEIATFLNKTFREDETQYYDSSAYRKKYRNFVTAYEGIFSRERFTDEQMLTYEEQKRELEKAKIKLRTEKLEYNRWLREDARDELICEKICDAIKTLPPLEVPNRVIPSHSNREGVLLLADAHYGAEFKIVGLFGETLNEYSPEIFEARMWDLLNQVVDICFKEGFDSLNVYDLGDEIDGLLRVSQLWKLRYGVIDSAVYYGRFITTWLNELSKHVYVKYQMVKDSNHCQLRLLGQPKNTFKDENVSVIIADKIMDRLSGNPNFEFVQNPTGLIFDNNVVGYSILGAHGECKNLEQAIKELSKTYRTQIDFMVGGHKHHQNSTNVGIESDVVAAPSIIGIDDYSLSLNKTSDPGATLFILESGRGKVQEYNIKL